MSNSQKVGEIHFYVPSFAGGGAERMFIRLANHLADRGEVVHFIVNHTGGPLNGLLSENVALHVLGTKKAIVAMPRLVRHLRKCSPAVLISALTRTNVVALAAARFAAVGTRVIACERNQYSRLSGNYHPIRRFLVTRMVRWLYPSAHAVIGNTEGVTLDIAEVARLEPGRTGVIHNPAPSIQQIEEARSNPKVHPWYSGERRVAVAIGRLVPQKDYPTMLRAVALAGEEFVLLVLGDGPELPYLKADCKRLGIEDRVEFLGFRMDRFAYLVHADVFLISSVTEGFPNALIEAVAAGVPAIATDFAGGGAQEILGRRFPDRIVPVGDAEAMASAMRSVALSDDVQRLDQDKARLAEIAAQYRMDRVADAFLERAAA